MSSLSLKINQFDEERTLNESFSVAVKIESEEIEISEAAVFLKSMSLKLLDAVLETSEELN